MDSQVVNNHGDSKSPRPGVVGPLPNVMAYKWGVILTTYKSWDDPPSRVCRIHGRRSKPGRPKKRLYTPEN